MIKALLIYSDGCKSCREWKPTFEKLMEQYNIEYDMAEDAEGLQINGLPLTIFYDDEIAPDETDIKPMDELLGNYTEEYARERIEKLISKACK